MWFKVDDKMHDHRKILRAIRPERGRLDAAPMGLWALAGAWCGDNRTDGFVPDYLIDRWDNRATELAARLIEAGLWEFVQVNGEDGYQFVNWHTWQPLRAEQEETAEQASRTKKLHQDPKLVNAIRDRDEGRCRYCGVGVSFSDRRSATGGTYDHIDPEGPNSLANVVVACRGCNSSKGRRTPDEAGMTLLRPGSLGPLRLAGQNGTRSSGQNGPRSGQKRRSGREQSPEASDPRSGLVGSGAEPDLDRDLDPNRSTS